MQSGEGNVCSKHFHWLPRNQWQPYIIVKRPYKKLQPHIRITEIQCNISVSCCKRYLINTQRLYIFPIIGFMIQRTCYYFFYDGCHVILYRLVSLYKVHGGYGPYKRRWYIYIDMATSWERECFNISEVTRTTKVRIRSGDRKEIYSFGLPDRTSPLQ